MRNYSRLQNEFLSKGDGPNVKKMMAWLILILSFSISPAQSAKPGIILYVDASAATYGDGTSWETAFIDLQSAIDAAVSGDEIWVAAGTYTPSKRIDNSSDPRTASFILKSGVKIYGSFAGDEKRLQKRQVDPSLTVLSGNIGDPEDDKDNSYHVVYANGVTDAVLDGFTVTGGRGDQPPGGFGGGFLGAGMYNENSALTVSYCTFSDNRVAVTTRSAGGLGAGMYNLNSAPIVSNCTFIANIAGNASNNTEGFGGGMYNEGSFGTGGDERWPIVTHCTFRENVASSHPSISFQYGGGGGMYNLSWGLIVDSCTFEGNWAGKGGGMYTMGMATIRNCIFIANYNLYSDGFGGAIFNMGSSTIVNCTFYQNGWRFFPSMPPRIMRSGGAIFEYRAGSTISNCIFSENAVFGSGGAVHSDLLYFRWTTLTNCLFYENKSWGNHHDPRDGVINHVGGDVDVVNALYDVDPLLVDPAGGDFHLRYDSPCMDAGYSLARGYLPFPLPMGLSTTDFEGDKRIKDGDGDGVPTVDIGVDEFVPNLPDLRAFLEALADSGELDEATAARLLDYVDAAQAALDQDEQETAINILNALIADVRASLGETETAQVINMKTEAVIEAI